MYKKMGSVLETLTPQFMGMTRIRNESVIFDTLLG